MKKLLVIALAGAVTACGGGLPHEPADVEAGFALKTSVASKVKILEQENFNLQLVRFSDSRTGESLTKLVEDDVIYEYEPNKLTSGLKARVGELAAYNLAKVGKYGKKDEYFMEIDLTLFRGYIARGGFVSGSLGRYVVDMEANVIVRDKTSKVIVNQAVGARRVENRTSSSTRHPTSEQDKARLLDMVDNAGAEVAINAAWLARKIINN